MAATTEPGRLEAIWIERLTGGPMGPVASVAAIGVVTAQSGPRSGSHGARPIASGPARAPCIRGVIPAGPGRLPLAARCEWARTDLRCLY